MMGNTTKGVAVSVVAHILFCALLGFTAIRLAKEVPPEPIYDVALVGAPGKPAPAAPPAPPPPVEQPKPQEEIVPPDPDDIIEEKQPEEPIPEPTPPTPPQPQPAPEAPPQPAPVATGGTAAEGTGEASGAATGDSSGGGDTLGVPPASDAIEAPAVPPSVTAARAPEYPYSAQRKGIEGTVVVRFLLNKDGGVDDVDVAESSGNDALDRAALEAAEGFSFSPGLDNYGRPVRCYAYQPFTFRLQ